MSPGPTFQERYKALLKKLGEASPHETVHINWQTTQPQVVETPTQGIAPVEERIAPAKPKPTTEIPLEFQFRRPKNPRGDWRLVRDSERISLEETRRVPYQHNMTEVVFRQEMSRPFWSRKP